MVTQFFPIDPAEKKKKSGSVKIDGCMDSAVERAAYIKAIAPKL